MEVGSVTWGFNLSTSPQTPLPPKPGEIPGGRASLGIFYVICGVHRAEEEVVLGAEGM